MDFYAFNCLPRDARAELVWQQGRSLAIRQEMNCSVVLYHLGGFFAEVCTHRRTTRSPRSLRL